MNNGYALRIEMYANQVREPSGPCFCDPETVAHAFRAVGTADREMFFVVTLSQKHQEIDRHLVSVGTLTAGLVHPREVFRPAIADGAAAIICVHNHPGGSAAPSKEDDQVAGRLREAGELLGIRVLDHLIITRTEYYSDTQREVDEFS